MKSKSIRVAISLTAVIVVVLWIMSCTTGPQNTNQAIKELNSNAANANTAAIFFDKACDESNIDSRVIEVQRRINEELEDDDELKEGRVKVLVRKVGQGYLELLVEGYAGGYDELNDLSHIIKKFMNKEKRCVLSVSFVPTGTVQPAANTSLNQIFRWSACEWPLIACPGGECAKACPMMSPTPELRHSDAKSAVNANSTSAAGKVNN